MLRGFVEIKIDGLELLSQLFIISAIVNLKKLNFKKKHT